MTTEKLTANEIKALAAIIDTCDDIDGDLFTRIPDALDAMFEVFGDCAMADRYYTDLLKKGYIGSLQIQIGSDGTHI